MKPVSYWILKFKKLWAWVVFVLVTTLCLAVVSWAATYNLYFNNTEQGDHSTASPSVTVTDGKVTTPTPSPTPPIAATEEAPAATEAPAAAPAATAPAASESIAQVKDYELKVKRSFNPWRVTGMGVGLSQKYTFPSEFASFVDPWAADYAYSNWGGVSGGAGLSLGYFFNRSAGVNVFGGAVLSRGGQSFFGGAELEIVPIRISLFGLEDLIETGFLLGANTIQHADGNFASLHAGLTASLNFGSTWALTSAVRANFGFVMADAGLSYRF